MATIRDVARLSGFSVSTVSIVLNNKTEERNIPPATAEKIRQAMIQLNYHPSSAASMLRSGKEKPVVALFWVLDNRSGFFMRVMEGMNRAMSAMGQPFEFVIHPYENGKLKELKEVILSHGHQGAIFGAMDREDLAFIESLPEELAICTVNRRSDRFSCCYSMPEQSGSIAAEYAEQHQCRSIAVVGGPTGSLPREARRASVVEQCEERGISEILQLTEAPTPAGGIAAAEKIAKLAHRPDLVYLDDEMMAFGFMAACRGMEGLDIQVLSPVLSYPGICQGINDAYAAIIIPAEEMGEKTAQIMAELLKGNRNDRIDQLCLCSVSSF